MIKKFLGIALATLLCIPSSGVLANTNINPLAKKINSPSKLVDNTALKNNNFKPILKSTSNTKKENKSTSLPESEKINAKNIQNVIPIKGNTNKSLLDSLQKSNEFKPILKNKNSVSTNANPTDSQKPIAQLKYAILNPDSLKNNQITTDTKIAWLWSYNGQNFTYDPNGYKITKLNVGGTTGVSDSIIGTLSGNIGFATQFKTPGQYIMTFKCMNDHNVWSDEWSISISVEPTDNNTRPQCIVTYSPIGSTNTIFTFDFGKSSDADANDSITSVNGLLLKNDEFLPISDYIVSKSGSTLSAKFKDPGTYTLMFRVCDSHNAWSNWVSFNIIVRDASSTPNNISLSDVWNRINSNSKNNTSEEAFGRSTPKSSQYFTSCIDSSGNIHDYYLLTLEDNYKNTSFNYLTQFDTSLIYDDTYLTSNQYNNGYYGTWYPQNSMSFGYGVMSDNLGYKKYDWVNFNDYKVLHIFDFFTGKDYSVEYFDGVGSKPYFLCYNMTNNDRIVYGRSHFFSDGSGESFLTRIDRKTGQEITNNNIIFGSNSEVDNGTMIDNQNYQFYSSRDGGYLWTINADTLQVVSKVAGTVQNGKFIKR